MLTCYHFVDVVGVRDQDVVKEGASHVEAVFNGNIPWSQHSNFIEDDHVLKSLVVKAYR